jgi:hypothetical protein
MTAPADHTPNVQPEDEALISGCPLVSRVELVHVSHLKNILADDELPATFRLKFLQWLDRRNRPGGEWGMPKITPEIVAAIDPMCESGCELLREAMKLGSPASINTVGREDVFCAFVALNPSLLTALRMARGQERRAA